MFDCVKEKLKNQMKTIKYLDDQSPDAVKNFTLELEIAKHQII